MATTAQWGDRGRTAILELLAAEHAAVWPEAEAMIAAERWVDQPLPR